MDSDAPTEAEATDAPLAAAVRICRICLRDDASLDAGSLVAPCACDGSVKWVHTRCLGTWVETVARRGSDASRCELCRQRYDAVEGLPTLGTQSFWRARGRAIRLAPACVACLLLWASPPMVRPLVLATASVLWWMCGFQDDALLCAMAIGALSLLGPGVYFGVEEVPSLRPGVALCFRGLDHLGRNPFASSVVLITEYSKHGAVGYIVNKGLDSFPPHYRAVASPPEFGDVAQRYGGPVPIAVGGGWEVLHTDGNVSGATGSGVDGVWVGGNRTQLAARAASEIWRARLLGGGNRTELAARAAAEMGPLAAEAHVEDMFQAMAVRGYAGWAPLQLDGEIRRQAWSVHSVTPELIFKIPIDDMWNVVRALPDVTWSKPSTEV